MSEPEPKTPKVVQKPMGYNAAIRYCAEYNPRLTRTEIKRLLNETIRHMDTDKKVISSYTAGFLVQRDGEGDLRVWVDPEYRYVNEND